MRPTGWGSNKYSNERMAVYRDENKQSSKEYQNNRADKGQYPSNNRLAMQKAMQTVLGHTQMLNSKVTFTDDENVMACPALTSEEMNNFLDNIRHGAAALKDKVGEGGSWQLAILVIVLLDIH